MKVSEYHTIEYSPATTWAVEGLATYCMTIPMGSINEERLFLFQEMERKNEVNPIEFVMNFKAASFHSLGGHEAVLNAYAQSWALTHFMMNRYRNQFIEYMRITADIRAKRGEEVKTTDDLQVLLKCVEKPLPILEQEFRDYMKTFPKVDDPTIKELLLYEKVLQDFKMILRTIKGRFV